jgi:CRISPR-associated protein (TIGR03984 family)
MNNPYMNNGLKLIKIKTIKEEPRNLSVNELDCLNSSEFISKINEIGLENNTFDVVGYFDQKVLIGNYKNHCFSFYNNEDPEIKFIQKLRIFNIKEEYLIWRSSGGYKMRHKIDSEGPGNEEEAVDSYQALSGTRSEKLNDGYVSLFEDRGTKIIMPEPPGFGAGINDEKRRVFIKTRNYIKYNDSSEAYYYDCRFVEFAVLSKEDLNG